jgi:hypothetical protein
VIFWPFLIDKSRQLDSFATDAMGEIFRGPMDCVMIIIGESKTTPDSICKPETTKPFISYEHTRLIDVPEMSFQELVHSHSIAAHYGKITTMKLLLIVGGCICALASLWGAVAICGTWFIVPRDHSMTAAHDILMRLAYTALFIMASAVFGACSLWAFRTTGILHE